MRTPAADGHVHHDADEQKTDNAGRGARPRLLALFHLLLHELEDAKRAAHQLVVGENTAQADEPFIGDHRDQGADGDRVGSGDGRRLAQLSAAQHGQDRGGLAGDVAAAGTLEGGGDLRPGQLGGLRRVLAPVLVPLGRGALDLLLPEPLLPLLQTDEAFFVLALSQKAVRLLKATQHEVAEVDVPHMPENMSDALGYEDLKNDFEWQIGAGLSGTVPSRCMVWSHGTGGIGCAVARSGQRGTIRVNNAEHRQHLPIDTAHPSHVAPLRAS